MPTQPMSGPGVQAERLVLALLFIDLSASSKLAAKLDAEQIAAVLRQLRLAVSRSVERYGGKVVRTQGDGVLAVFGYPTPSEHDTRNACQAAIDAHAEVAQWPSISMAGGSHKLELHSGVHSGLVLVSEGDIERGRLDLIGDAPNTVARLSMLAAPGEILVDTESLGPELGFFRSSVSRLVDLPGRPDPVPVVSLAGMGTIRCRFEGSAARGLSPLVGRSSQLEQLLALCTGPYDGDPRLIELRGQAGMGKTRLLEEAATRLGGLGLLCLRGSCDVAGASMVLAPFYQVMSKLELLAPPPAPAPRAESSLQERLLEAIAGLQDRRPVLLLDDWQWADDASRQLLDALIERCPAMPVVAAMRLQEKEAVGSRGWKSLPLEPFTLEQTRSTAVVWAPGTSPFAVEQLHEYAGGVPLLVEELCHTLRQRGEDALRVLRYSSPSGGPGGWMMSMMAARLKELPPRLQGVVQAAAVVGVRAPRALLELLVSAGLADDDLQQLSEADILFPASQDTFRFRHGLTRDAVYKLIPRERRIEMHRRVVDVLAASPEAALSQGETLEALAHHTASACDWVAAIGRCGAAADHAMRLNAFDTARRDYVRAVEAAENAGLATQQDVLRWCGLVHKLGMTCMFDPLALPEVMPLVQRCVSRARDLDEPETIARSLYWYAYLSYVFGLPREAARLAHESLDIAQRFGLHRLVVQVEATLAQSLAAACQYDESLALMSRALHAKREGARGGGSVPVGSAFTLACQASVLADRGEVAAALALLEEARRLVGPSLHPVANSVRNWEMVVLAWLGRWKEALLVVDESIRIAERSRALLPLAIARAVGGYARWRLDGAEHAMTDVSDAVNWMEERDVMFFTTIYYGWLVEMCVCTGRPAEARLWAARLLRRARVGERLGEAVGWRALAWEAVARGDLARCRIWLRRAQTSALRRGSAREQALNELLEAELMLAQGRVSEARTLWDGAEARLGAMAALAGRPPWGSRQP